MDEPPTSPQTRGLRLLVAHCHALELERPTARERLEEALGPELARMLLFALAPAAGRGERRAAA